MIRAGFLIITVIIFASGCGIESMENTYKWRIETADKLIRKAGPALKLKLQQQKIQFQKEYDALPKDVQKRETPLGDLNTRYYRFLDDMEEQVEKEAEQNKLAATSTLLNRINGHWVALGFDLLITGDGSVEYKRVQGGIKKNLTGKIHSISEDAFTVSVLGIKTVFKINKLPYRSAGKMKMVVDGVELTRM